MNGNGRVISMYCCEREELFWRRPCLVKWKRCSAKEEENGAIKLTMKKKMRIANLHKFLIHQENRQNFPQMKAL